MRVLLVEPAYRRLGVDTKRRADAASDESLWYPPLGLMKLSHFHRARGDEVRFAYGCDSTVFQVPDLFSPGDLWDRVYITTLFTYKWKETIRTIEFYKDAVGQSKTKVFVGGVMASLMPEDIFEETGIYPITGVLNSPQKIGLDGDENIDLIAPDYDLVEGSVYAINETFYGYTSRGCVNDCPWCGVPKIEPEFVPYIDIKPTIKYLRKKHGDMPVLKLMDNNVLASPKLVTIVEDLLELGYGHGEHTNEKPPRKRVVDFNQGLDARHFTEDNMQLLGQLNINPMRIGFDRVQDKHHYKRAVQLARHHGIKRFSNYMLFNFKDTPRDLYERLSESIKINEEWQEEEGEDFSGGIYSYPMRYAPIDERGSPRANRTREYMMPQPQGVWNPLEDAVWNSRFIRNIGVMCGAAHGALSSTPSLAWRTIGADYEEFIANLYMPEALLRNRNRYERKVYEYEPERPPGTGDVEAFREFVLRRLRKPDKAFWMFHGAVSENRRQAVRDCMDDCQDSEVNKWLEFYLLSQETDDQ